MNIALTSIAIYLATWRMVSVPFAIGMFGFLVLQAVYFAGIAFAVYRWMGGADHETHHIGFKTED